MRERYRNAEDGSIAEFKLKMFGSFKDEGLSGATTKRPALLRSEELEHGDTLIVWKLDRLGRSLRDLITMLDDLRARRIKFHSLTEAIEHGDTDGPRHVADDGVLAELERVGRSTLYLALSF